MAMAMCLSILNKGQVSLARMVVRKLHGIGCHDNLLNELLSGADTTLQDLEGRVGAMQQERLLASQFAPARNWIACPRPPLRPKECGGASRLTI